VEPKWGRWTYWEKFDYLAVFWGMIVIGASGLTLWFPEAFSKMFPGWLINAAHIIHSEEALLATAFIFTVHFFNTHLRPGAFPLDEAIFTGRITEERFEEERSLQKDLLSKGDYKEALVKPLKTWQKIILKIFGYILLIIGLGLLALIVVGTFF
jgi:cytochrome b subunit of formate dehydrogenase